MRVFVTGASGHIGSAVVPELLAAGHQVVGLARSEASADALRRAGAEVRRGDLRDPADLGDAAREADGVIHLAFSHEAMRSGAMEDAATLDLDALQVMGEALADTGKPLVGTGGLLVFGMFQLGRPGTESDTFPGGPRLDAENYVIGLADRGVRSSVVRLPPTVHSTLDHHGFVPSLITFARAYGAAGYLDEGANRWPAVHTLDAAHLYRVALEGAPAGSRLHAVGDEGVPFRDLAGAIGRGLDLPVRQVPADEAEAAFGFLAGFAGLDAPSSGAQSRDLLHWAPEHPGLLDDLAEGHYFSA